MRKLERFFKSEEMSEEKEAWENAWHLCVFALNKRWVPTGAELRRYGKPHCALRQGREGGELFGGGQWAEPRGLRSAGVGSQDVAGRSLTVLQRQPQQAQHCYD